MRLIHPDQLQAIRRYTFSQLICDTATDTYSIQPNPFRQTNSASNRRIRCNPHSSLDLSPWLDVDSNSGKVQSSKFFLFVFICLTYQNYSKRSVILNN